VTPPPKKKGCTSKNIIFTTVLLQLFLHTHTQRQTQKRETDRDSDIKVMKTIPNAKEQFQKR
jgi:hypothetical protein